MKLVHQNDTPRQQSEGMRRLGERLRKILAEIMTTESPFIPPDRPPPGSPGQRIARILDDLPEEAEAAERKVIAK